MIRNSPGDVDSSLRARRIGGMRNGAENDAIGGAARVGDGGGKVVVFLSSDAERPISWVSNESPSDNRLFRSSRISQVAAEISGPIPSPGRITSRMLGQHLNCRAECWRGTYWSVRGCL